MTNRNLPLLAILLAFIISTCDAQTRIKFKRRLPRKNEVVSGDTLNLSARVRAGRTSISSTSFQIVDDQNIQQDWITATSGSRPGDFQASVNIPSGSSGVWKWRVKTSLTNGTTKTGVWYTVEVRGSGDDDPVDDDDDEDDESGDGGSGDAVGDAKADILALARSDNRLKAKFLRLGFHDCVGGCDGCVNMNNPDNKGLDVPIDALQPIVDRYASRGLSRADIWALATLVGAESSQSRNTGPSYSFDWIGRVDCSSSNGKSGPDPALPSADLDNAGILHYFDREFGYTPRETVALMGAHSIGTLSRENSGFTGNNGWNRNNRVLDVGYYRGLIGGRRRNDPLERLLNAPQWRQRTVRNNSLPGIPDRRQWTSGRGNRQTIMTNADIALVRDISSMDSNGNVSCEFKGRRNACPHAQKTFDDMADFKFNQSAWLREFRNVLSKMVTHGYDSGTCSNPPCTLIRN